MRRQRPHEQITDNLFSNVFKFTEAGNIRFIARYKGGTFLLTVEDTGIGMNEETTAYIFNPFERSAHDTNSEGFGLGLSITKGLVGLLGGEIAFSSEVGKASKILLTNIVRTTQNFIFNAAFIFDLLFRFDADLRVEGASFLP